MVTLVSAALGLAGSLLPEALNFFKDKEKAKKELAARELDYKQELAVLDKQAIMAEKGHLRELEIRELDILSNEADADLQMNLVSLNAGAQQVEGVPWVNALNSSIRPILTYCFFIFFCFANGAVIFKPELQPVVAQVYNPEVHALFVCMISYFFGSRGFKHARKLK